MTLEQRISALAAAIGADIKALGGAGPDITAIEALTGTGLIERTGEGTAAVVTITAAGKALLDDIDAAAQRATLGLGNVDNTADASKPISSATQTALNAKAPLASPTFTGTPAAPTALPVTNNTQIATTAFVQAAISALIDASPGALDTLNELAAAIGDDPNFAATITNGLAAKLAKASNLSDLMDKAAARTNLGLSIGSNVQAWDGDLDAIAALTGTTGLLKKTGANTWVLDGSSYLTSITSAQVTGALGFTPANKAGDTFTGTLLSGDPTPTGGSFLLGDRYGAGSLATYGSTYGSSGPILGYGVRSQANAAGTGNEYRSTTAINIGRSVFEVAGNVLRFRVAPTQQVAIGSATTGWADFFQVDSSGRMTIPYQPSFRAVGGNSSYSTVAGQSFACGSVGHNIGGHYNASNGRFTAPVSGTYHFSYSTTVLDGGGNASTAFVLNGAIISHILDYSGADSSCQSISIYMAANDWIAAYGMAANNGSWTVWNNSYQTFSGHLVG